MADAQPAVRQLLRGYFSLADELLASATVQARVTA